MISEEKIKEVEQRLIVEKRELEKNIAEHSATKNFGDEGHVEDFESAKADEAEELSNDLAVAQAYRNRLEEVENTLNRIKEGRYGICEECGRTIPEKLLEKQPTQARCEECG